MGVIATEIIIVAKKTIVTWKMLIKEKVIEKIKIRTGAEKI